MGVTVSRLLKAIKEAKKDGGEEEVEVPGTKRTLPQPPQPPQLSTEQRLLLREFSEEAFKSMLMRFIQRSFDDVLKAASMGVINTAPVKNQENSKFIQFKIRFERMAVTPTELMTLRLPYPPPLLEKKTLNVYNVDYIHAKVPGFALSAPLFNLAKWMTVLNPGVCQAVMLNKVYYPTFWVTDSDFGWIVRISDDTNRTRYMISPKLVPPDRLYPRLLFEEGDHVINARADLSLVDLIWFPPVQRSESRTWQIPQLQEEIVQIDNRLAQRQEFTDQKRDLSYGLYSCMLRDVLEDKRLLSNVTETCRMLGNLDFCTAMSQSDVSWGYLCRFYQTDANLSNIRALVWEEYLVMTMEMAQCFLAYLIDYGRATSRPVFVHKEKVMSKLFAADVTYPLGRQNVSPYFMPLKDSPYCMWCPQKRPHTTKTGMELLALPDVEEPLAFEEKDPSPKKARMERCFACGTMSAFHERHLAFRFCDSVCKENYFY